jgi:amino acid transporter
MSLDTSTAVPAAPPARRLKRSMGLWMATALVVGNMIGSGVFLLPASLAGTAGPISIFGWTFTGAGAMLLALVFANLGRALPRTGGPYAYAKRAFGDFIGFQTAWATGSPCGPATPRSPWPSSATWPSSGPPWRPTSSSARSPASR